MHSTSLRRPLLLAGLAALSLGCAAGDSSAQTDVASETEEVNTAQPQTKGVRSVKYEKPSEEVLKQKLTPLQYRVTQDDDTEPAFRNEYNDNKQAGIYVDVVSGEPLFSSLDKFDSGTGWPSFTRPLEQENVTLKKDRKFFVVRTEVRSKHADSHLGHVFDDGPAPTGQRYCMNSAAMRFVPVEKLEEEGYGEYLSIFGREGTGEAGGGKASGTTKEPARATS